MLYRRLYFCFILIVLFFGKLHGQENFEKIRHTYEGKNENDITALRGVNNYISKAKLERNLEEQVQGYRDATFYSKNVKNKIIYADSAIITAQKYGEKQLISTVYLLKGSLYYFYYKNYQSALAEYLKAYNYSKDGKDSYLKYKIIYQIGLVKSYLGYYHEAIEHFEECISYFESKTKEKHHPNALYNFNKGYLNSLHQIAVCYRSIKNYEKADSITDVGLGISSKSKSFPLEDAYFLNNKGISGYQQKQYKSSLVFLQKALPVFNKNEDFYWASVSNFYIGKNYLNLGKTELAIKQYEIVDSIFQKRKFIFPELLENYNSLIKYYQKKGDIENELRYSKNLLKADSILGKDFSYLSARIHKDYDKKILEDSKNRLENHNKISVAAIVILVIILILSGVLTWRYYRKAQMIKSRYYELEKKLQHKSVVDSVSYQKLATQGKQILSEEVFNDLDQKIKEFEAGTEFKENGLTIDQLAATFNTNKSYLSQYINDVKAMNFSKYISTLRINYITKLMYDDPHYLRLKVQGLATECGISSRQNFSDLFQDINGIRPGDFIKQRKKELEEVNQQNISAFSSKSTIG